MWGKRKAKNRRLDRDHLLNVKLSPSQHRGTGLRVAGMALTAAFLSIFLLAVVWRGGEWMLNRLLYENPAFAVEQIVVQTDGVLAADPIRRWSLVRQGDNLLSLDLGRVKRDLELVPLIQSASVERVLPHTLRLRVSEREPVAQIVSSQLQAGGGIEPVIYHLDESGYVMQPLDPRLRVSAPITLNEVLPTISGINPSELRPGRQVDSVQVREALQFISAFEHSPMVGLVTLQKIDVTSPEILQVLTSQGSEILISNQQTEAQLHRWRLAYDYFLQMGKSLASLDLSVSNNVPARWIEASAVPPVAPKTAKPSRPKKKNV